MSDQATGGRLAEIKASGNGMQLATMADYWTMAKTIVAAKLAPAGMDTPGVLIALQAGAEIGMPPIQSLKNIAVINGRPTIYGDALMALAYRTGKVQAFEEWIDGEGDDMRAVCRIKRRDLDNVIERSFSVADAKEAGLWGQKGPWSKYKRRMLTFRARGFCVRDAFPDALGGLMVAEEVRDMGPDDGNDGHASRSDAMLAQLQGETEAVDAQFEPEPASPGSDPGSAPPSSGEPESAEPTPEEQEEIRRKEMAEAGLFPEESNDA